MFRGISMNIYWWEKCVYTYRCIVPQKASRRIESDGLICSYLWLFRAVSQSAAI